MILHRARYVDVLVVEDDGVGAVRGVLPDGTPVTIGRRAFEDLYVPVLSTTAEIAESVG